MKRLLVASGKCTGEETMQEAIGDHRAGIGKRRIVPAVAADVHEAAKVREQMGQRFVTETIGMRNRGVRVDRRFEPFDSSGQEQVLPRRLCGDDDELHRLLQTVGGSHALCRGVFGADELIERAREHVTERHRSQDGVDAGQVVVHPRAMDADDLAQRRLHQRQAVARHPKRAPEVAKVVVVAKTRDRVEQRGDWLRKVFVDVRVRPLNLRVAGPAALWPRGYRTALNDPELAVTINRPFDVLRRAEGVLDVERKSRQFRDLEVVEQERFCRRGVVRRSGLRPSREAGAGRPVARGPADRNASGIDRPRHERFTHPTAILEQHLVRAVR